MMETRLLLETDECTSYVGIVRFQIHVILTLFLIHGSLGWKPEQTSPDHPDGYEGRHGGQERRQHPNHHPIIRLPSRLFVHTFGIRLLHVWHTLAAHLAYAWNPSA